VDDNRERTAHYSDADSLLDMHHDAWEEETEYVEGFACPSCSSPYARIIAPLGCLVHACCRHCGAWSIIGTVTASD
jgi:hypothetical protein